jgi:hypothetical protein
MTPGEAIRKFCIDCVGGIAQDVPSCGGDKCLNGGCDKKGGCLFYPYRMGRGRPSVKTIRKMCLWCMGDDAGLVRQCPGHRDKEGVYCDLWPFRFGNNPNIVLSDEAKFQRVVRLRLVRKEELLGQKTA